jgi:MOSC domain-containing protein
MAEREVGRVSALWRYPVKSMAAEAIRSVAVGWHGLAGDRRWAFVRPGTERSGFPWLTIREAPQLWRYQPYFADSANVEASRTIVRTPDGSELEVADLALAAHFGDGVRVMKQYSGVFDAMPLSLLTVQSVEELSALVGSPLSPCRFRPNILIDAPASGAFLEDTWTGAVLRIGKARLRVDQRDKRCLMVNIDPSSLESDPRVLRAIAQERDARFGVYGTVVEPGEIAVGDSVLLQVSI